MKVEAEIPDGYHISHAESSRIPGGFHWFVWLRVSPLGQSRGGQGDDLQAAVDDALVNLKREMSALEVVQNVTNLPDLSHLKLEL